jgi:DNA mismatch repair protein MutH
MDIERAMMGVQASFRDVEEVENLLLKAEGKSFAELDMTNRGKSQGNKGSLGQIIEESVLQYEINSDSRADIEVGDTRYEIKVTPVRYVTKKGRRALVSKERLVMDIINYMKLPDQTFLDSTFWQKARNLIIVYYLDDRMDRRTQPRSVCKVIRSFIIHYPDQDLRTIQDDWETIRSKVSQGHADILSEADTNYLAACTKGATAASSFRDAPGPSGQGKIRAKQRAFSYKQSYMSTLVEQLLGNLSNLEQLEQPSDQSLTEYIENTLGKEKGKTAVSLAQQYGVDHSKKAKNYTSLLALAILKTQKRSVTDIAQFKAANVNQMRTIVVYRDGCPREHISFPAIKTSEWNEISDMSISWEDSTLYHFLTSSKFLITVFRSEGNSRDEISKDSDTLRGGFLWNMPARDIEQFAKPVWLKVQELLQTKGSIHYETNNQLPGPSYNHVFHVRPHARDRRDCITLPNGESITKQAFWLDKQYLGEVIRKHFLEERL